MAQSIDDLVAAVNAMSAQFTSVLNAITVTKSFIDNAGATAAGSVSASAASATAAAGSASAASQSATSANAAATQANTLLGQAQTSLNQALAALSTISTTLTSAQTAATNSANSATAANTSKNAASASATAAATSATNAAASAASILGAQAASAASAAAALVSQNAAAGSATAAAQTAANVAQSLSDANTAAQQALQALATISTSLTAAQTAATNSANSATAANTSKNAAGVSETNAGSSATNAHTSEVNAAASATASANSATASATSAGNSHTSETNAAASAASAAESAQQATAGQIPSDWNQPDPSAKDYIKNKPALPTKTSLGLDQVDNTADVNKSVAHAVSADTATNATNATHAVSADTASAVSWANINNRPFTSIGNGLSVDANGVLKSFTYTLPIASSTTRGGIKVGANLTIDGDGILSASNSYSLPQATPTVLGGLQLGKNLSLNSITGQVDAAGGLSSVGTVDSPSTVSGNTLSTPSGKSILVLNNNTPGVVQFSVPAGTGYAAGDTILVLSNFTQSPSSNGTQLNILVDTNNKVLAVLKPNVLSVGLTYDGTNWVSQNSTIFFSYSLTQTNISSITVSNSQTLTLAAYKGTIVIEQQPSSGTNGPTVGAKLAGRTISAPVSNLAGYLPVNGISRYGFLWGEGKYCELNIAATNSYPNISIASVSALGTVSQAYSQTQTTLGAQSSTRLGKFGGCAFSETVAVLAMCSADGVAGQLDVVLLSAGTTYTPTNIVQNVMPNHGFLTSEAMSFKVISLTATTGVVLAWGSSHSTTLYLPFTLNPSTGVITFSTWIVGGTQAGGILTGQVDITPVNSTTFAVFFKLPNGNMSLQLMTPNFSGTTSAIGTPVVIGTNTNATVLSVFGYSDSIVTLISDTTNNQTLISKATSSGVTPNVMYSTTLPFIHSIYLGSPTTTYSESDGVKRIINMSVSGTVPVINIYEVP